MEISNKDIIIITISWIIIQTVFISEVNVNVRLMLNLGCFRSACVLEGFLVEQIFDANNCIRLI